MPRGGYTHVLVADGPDAYRRIRPSAETTVTLENNHAALLGQYWASPKAL